MSELKHSCPPGCHWWKASRHYRVPCRGWWPSDPMGSIEYQVFICEACGKTRDEEVPYSWRPGKLAWQVVET